MTISKRDTDGLRNIRRSVAILFSGQILTAAGAMIVNLLAARVLDPTPRGDLAYALQMAYFLTVFIMMGLERPFIAARSGDFNSEFRIFVRMLLPSVLAVIPVTLLVTAFSPFSTDWLWWGAIAIAIYVVFNAVILGIRVAYIASGHWKKFSFNVFLSQIIIVSGAITLVVLEISDPIIWMWIYTLSTLPSVILLCLAYRDRHLFNPLTSAEKKKLRKKGWILLPATFSSRAMQRADRLLLPILGTSADLGLYVTVATVIEMATWPVQQWVDASLRGWSQKADVPKRLIWKILIQALVLLLVMSTLLGLAAHVMIVLFLPDAYRAALVVIPPLIAAATVYGFTRVQQGILIAFGAESRVTFVDIFGVAISLFAYMLFIPMYGMLGAAYGNLAGSTACAIAATVALVRFKGKNV